MTARMKRFTKGIAVGTLFMVYQAPGCDFSLDGATLQSLFTSFAESGDVKLELELDSQGGDGLEDDFHDESEHQHEDEGEGD